MPCSRSIHSRDQTRQPSRSAYGYARHAGSYDVEVRVRIRHAGSYEPELRVRMRKARGLVRTRAPRTDAQDTRARTTSRSAYGCARHAGSHDVEVRVRMRKARGLVRTRAPRTDAQDTRARTTSRSAYGCATHADSTSRSAYGCGRHAGSFDVEVRVRIRKARGAYAVVARGAFVSSGPGTSSMRMRPCRRQPSRNSHVFGSHTINA